MLRCYHAIFSELIAPGESVRSSILVISHLIVREGDTGVPFLPRSTRGGKDCMFALGLVYIIF